MRTLLKHSVVYWLPFLLGLAGWLISALILDALFLDPVCGGPAQILPHTEPDNEVSGLACTFDQIDLMVLWVLVLAPAGCTVAGWLCSRVGLRRGSARAAFVPGLLGVLGYYLMKLALGVIAVGLSAIGEMLLAALLILCPMGIAHVIGFAIGSHAWADQDDVQWAEPALTGPLWSVVRSQGLWGIGTGTRVPLDVEGNTLVVSKAGDSVASFPLSGVRLVPAAGRTFELRDGTDEIAVLTPAGTDEIAVLTPAGADPAALLAVLEGAGP